MNEALFKMDVEKAVKTAIAHLDRGTVGISADCLWQLTRIHSVHGPTGAVAGWTARQIFNEIITGKRYRNFVYLS